MYSTLTLQRTADFAKMHVANSPLMFQSNTYGDPLFCMADSVRQFILAPPFAWRWNRSQASATLVQGQQDFQISLSDFGWLEKGIYIDPSGATFELKVQETLGQESSQSQPNAIATVNDDGQNITFRVFPPPPDNCTVNLIYQKAAGTFKSPADTWEPIPDWLSYLIFQGMKWQTYEYKDDPRAITAAQLFVKQVLSANEGLTDSQKSLFIPELAYMQKTQTSMMRKSQLGDAARGLL
jgi:hypothetical protein